MKTGKISPYLRGQIAKTFKTSINTLVGNSEHQLLDIETNRKRSFTCNTFVLNCAQLLTTNMKHHVSKHLSPAACLLCFSRLSAS